MCAAVLHLAAARRAPHLQVECPPEGACHLLGARVEREVADWHTEGACRRGRRVHVLWVGVVWLQGLVAAAAGAACEGATGRRQVERDTHMSLDEAEGSSGASCMPHREGKAACCTHWWVCWVLHPPTPACGSQDACRSVLS